MKTWSADEGYVKAPVSYDGEMIPAYGGGVCQTSTTLYNAVLLAGMPIVERHRHLRSTLRAAGKRRRRCPREHQPRFRNPNPWPIRIEASARSDKLIVRLIGAEKSKQTVEIITQVIDRQNPERLTRRVRLDAYGRRFARIRGPRVTV